MMPRLLRRDVWFIVALALTLAAFAFRLIDLTSRSLWLDESFTLLRINDSWQRMWANIVMRQGIGTTDLNPPLYFTLLKVWSDLAGFSEFALKTFSALGAVMVVPLTYVLGRQLGGARVGMFAAVLALLCGAYAWYAAELRMYTLMACIGALVTYALVRALQTRSWFWGTVWLIALGLGVFTHYSFIGLALGQGALVALLLIRRVRLVLRDRSAWMAIGLIGLALLIVIVIGVPTLARAAQLATNALTNPRGSATSVLSFIQEIVNALLFGLNATDPTGWLISAIALALVLVGAVSSAPKRVAVMMIISIVVPIAFWLVLSFLLENKPSFRYVIFIFPIVQALMAHGLVRLWERGAEERSVPWRRALPVGAGIVVLLAMLHGTRMAYTRTTTYQDDWRTFGLALRKEWQPGDVLIINLNTPEAVMPYVMGDLSADVTYARDWLMTPRDAALNTLGAFNRIWYANTGGDAGYQNAEMQSLLQSFFLKQRIEFAGRTTTIELLAYETKPDIRAALPEGAIAVPDAPQDRTALVGYAFRPGSPHHPNATFILDAYWRRGDDAHSKRALTLRLSRNGQTWLDWSLDAMLRRAPELWTNGMLFRQSYLVPVPPGLPVQPYDLTLLARAGEKGEVFQEVRQPLPTDALACCVRVADWASAGERWRTTDVALAIAEYSEVIKPGQVLPVALTWRALQTNLPTWQTELTLDALLGGQVSQTKQDAGTPDFLPSAWPINQLARDQLALQVPHDVAPGWYRLSLSRYRDGVRVDGTVLGIIRVEDYPRTPVSTDIQHSVNATVGDVTLLGYTARVPFERGKTNVVFTHWRANAPLRRDGKLFLHIIGPDGALVAQDDDAPFDGQRSTLTFRRGDGIEQTHIIDLKPDLPAGTYTLYAGIYDADGAQARWPSRQNDAPALNDLVKLGTFTLP
jgi:uncharacterized membrane protein